MSFIIWNILKKRRKDIKGAIEATLEVEVIYKKNDYILRRAEEAISVFICL